MKLWYKMLSVMLFMVSTVHGTSESNLITPTPVPTFSVTIQVIPTTTQVFVNQTLDIEVRVINNSVGCIFPVYQLTLTQIGSGAPIFAPPSITVGPPVSSPTTFQVTATTPGTINFRATAYGERYCNDYWQWMYIHGDSVAVSVIVPTPTVVPTPPPLPSVSPSGFMLLILVMSVYFVLSRKE